MASSPRKNAKASAKRPPTAHPAPGQAKQGPTRVRTGSAQGVPQKPAGIYTLQDLIPDPSNRRQHPERNVQMVADALQDVGASRSIVIDEGGVVLAGNGVVEAAKRAGLVKVQVVEADGQTLVAVRRRGLTDEKKRALAIYDNRTGELSEWNAEQLRLDQSAGLTLKPFWTDTEEAMLLGQPVDPTWDGMPEFHQEKVAWHTIRIHFAKPEDLEAFAALVQQGELTTQTKYLWFPPRERTHEVGVQEFVTSE